MPGHAHESPEFAFTICHREPYNETPAPWMISRNITQEPALTFRELLADSRLSAAAALCAVSLLMIVLGVFLMLCTE
jgi:hypothetical protein